MLIINYLAMKNYFKSLSFITILLTVFIIIFFIAFNFSDNPPTQSGWYQQFIPNLNGRVINDITFTDSLNGYIITNLLTSTDSSIILKTTNGGDNWFYIHSDSGDNYSKIKFINQNTGFVGGYISTFPNNYILKTTNAGINWNYLNTPSFQSQDDMFVLNPDTIWFISSEPTSGGLFRTTNGGQNWQLLFSPFDYLQKIYMYNRNIGFISKSQTNASLFKTTNSGINWVQVTGEDGFYDIKFVDSLTGWKAKGTMKKTTDGGLTWTQQILPSGGNIISNNFNKFSVVNRDTLWGVGGEIIIGSQARGTIYRTTDGGINWLFQIPDTSIHVTLPYTYVMFVNAKIGWAYTLGFMGGIHTTTGGDTEWLIGIKKISNKIPKEFNLYQNYPNPFNPRTIIPYSIKTSAYVKLIAYDILGREVQRMVDQKQQAGEYEVDFMGKFVSSGIYFYSLFVNDKLIDTKKMILLK